MGGFFHGWRRKVSLLTLAAACVFMGLWVRGVGVQDSVIFGFEAQETHPLGSETVTRGRTMDWLSSSAKDGFVWTRERSAFDIFWIAGWKSHRTDSDSYFDPLQFDPLNSKNPTIVDSHWQLLGFDVGRYRRYYGYDTGENDTFSFWRISYISIVLPLTATALWLLLDRRPKSWH